MDRIRSANAAVAIAVAATVVALAAMVVALLLLGEPLALIIAAVVAIQRQKETP